MSQEAWYILITEEIGNSRRELTRKEPATGDVVQARERALRRAREYSPMHPMREKGRAIYQTSQDSWMVEVKGATNTFVFIVQLARWVE